MVITGPDLNQSRSPLDRKLYRTILLENGIQCLLIQDTLAMHQEVPMNDDDSDSSEEDIHEDDGDDSSSSMNDGLRDAAAAVVVGAGSLYDPLECQGLAHFLEHLLFMGSEKYPDENEYEAYIAKHGGCDNAWTDWECTNYHFSIAQPYLFGALDRLAQFFVAPLLLENCVDRELQAVESEFQLQKNNDNSRLEQLRNSTYDASHPFRKFSWGNLRSIQDVPAKLGIDKMKLLRQFYNQYYYGANMRVVVMGAYTLDELETRVQESFRNVPALPREPSSLPLPIPDTSQIGKEFVEYQSPFRDAGMPWTEPRIYRIVPVKDRHLLSITWPLPSQLPNWKTKPVDFIAHLMGHEASGSILSCLREKSWALGCCAGVEQDAHASSHSLFTIEYTLSRKGMKHWKEIVGITYQYIGMMKYYKGNWPEWIYEELKTIQEVSYMYGDEHDPEEFVEEMAENMAPQYLLPPERLLDGFHMLFGFNAEMIDDYLDLMTPSRARIDILSSTFGVSTDYEISVDEETTDLMPRDLIVHEESEGAFDKSQYSPQTEPMFGTSFWCHAVSNETILEWARLCEPQLPEASLSLPPKNPFVPESYALKPRPQDDADHPLLHSSLKLCVQVGKTKQWFAATVVRFDKKKNSLLLSYEDEDEQWHSLDHTVPDDIEPDYEGTFDEKKTKFRLLAISHPGSGVVRKFGDGSDMNVEEGKSFPPIPPPAQSNRLPRLIFDNNNLKMWFLQDRIFHRPIAEFRLQIVCEEANKTPLHRACAELTAQLCADASIETAYLASVAELGSHIEATDYGFYIRLHGFDNKLIALFDDIFPLLLSFGFSDQNLPGKITKDRFDACLELLLRRYRNSNMSVSKMVASVRLRALKVNSWSAPEKETSIANIDLLTFCKTMKSILSSFAIECLLHGNVCKSEADEVRKKITHLLPSDSSGLPRKKYPPHSVLKFPEVNGIESFRFPSKDPSDPNTAVEVYFQVGKDNLRDRVLIDLLIFMMDEPFYAEVRTKDQFGYDVHCDVRWTYGIMGFIFKIVTNVKSGDESVHRIEDFLNYFRETLVNMSNDDFMEHVVGLASHKLDMYNSLTEEVDSHWAEIRDGRFEWESHREEAIILREVKKEEVMNAFDQWIRPGTPRKVLAIQVIGSGDGSVSNGRPAVESKEELRCFYQDTIQSARTRCKNQVWGKVNSKLF